MSEMTKAEIVATLHQVDILREVAQERVRQDAKHPGQVIDRFHWLAVLGEEVGEANKAANENNLTEMRAELIQVAGVAVRIIEMMDAGRLAEQQPKPAYSKGGLYGCLSPDCEGCTDAECTPGAEWVTEERAVELGWLTQEQVDRHRERAKGRRANDGCTTGG